LLVSDAARVKASRSSVVSDMPDGSASILPKARS